MIANYSSNYTKQISLFSTFKASSQEKRLYVLGLRRDEGKEKQ